MLLLNDLIKNSGENKMRKITLNGSGTRVDIAMLGPDWFGLIYYRIYAAPDVWMTFRGVKLFWFTLSIKVPAYIEDLIDSKKRAPW
jgi:hypothetical protein